MTLILTMFLAAQAHAGIWKRFCENYLAEDPWPYAEFTTDDLFLFHYRRADMDVTKELVFRYRSGMMDVYEREAFERAFGIKRKRAL